METASNAKRVLMIDALRGFSLFFILISNVPLDTGYVPANPLLENTDKALLALWTVLVSRKFLTIFSILFGFGMYKLLAATGQDDRRRLAVRMGALMAIGVAHGYLLWFGDIIRSYALCGLMLLWLAHWPTRRLLWTAALCTVAGTGIVFIGNSAFGWQSYRYDPSVAATLPLLDSWRAYLQANFTIDPWVNFLQDMPLTLFFCMGNIILGYVLGRSGFLERLPAWTSPGGWRLWTLLLFGISCSVLLLLIEKGTLELSMGMIWLPFVIVAGLVSQSMAYILLFGHFELRAGPTRLLRGLAYVGRLSLSNYLLQTLWYLLIFYHALSPLALFGKMGVSATYALCAALYGLQVWASRWWMRRFGHGPAEYVFRRLSHGLGLRWLKVG